MQCLGDGHGPNLDNSPKFLSRNLSMSSKISNIPSKRGIKVRQKDEDEIVYPETYVMNPRLTRDSNNFVTMCECGA